MALNVKSGIVGAFLLGFGLGTTAHKWWPALKEYAVPAGKSLLKMGMDTTEKAKELFWDKSEKFADVMAEVSEERKEQTSTPKPRRPKTKELDN